MVYMWNFPKGYPEKWIGEYDYDRGPDRFLFSDGTSIDPFPAQPPLVRFAATGKQLTKFHELTNDAMVPLVDSNIAEVLKNTCPDQVQFLPAELKCKDTVINDYSFLIATKKVIGIDHKQSVYSHVHGTTAIMGFRKAVYKEGCLGSFDLARDEEYLSHLLVSERLYRSLSNLTNGICTFDDWYSSLYRT